MLSEVDQKALGPTVIFNWRTYSLFLYCKA